jgi:hypothetical protein
VVVPVVVDELGHGDGDLFGSFVPRISGAEDDVVGFYYDLGGVMFRGAVVDEHTVRYV